jgi:hypothetical protein
MNIKILLVSIFIIFSLVINPIMGAEIKPNEFTDNLVKNLVNEAPSFSPGNGGFNQNPNEIQEIYMKSIPGLVKISNYIDYEVFVPYFEYYSLKSNFDGNNPMWSDVIISGQDNSINDISYYYENETGFYSNLYYSGGSGFIIHPEGYVLTNAHVAINDVETMEEELAYWWYIYPYELLLEEAYYDDSYSAEDFWDIWVNLNYLIENIEIRNLVIKDTLVGLGVNKSEMGFTYNEYDSTVIDYNNEYLNENGVMDWALLKIDGSNFPTLPLGDSDLVSSADDIIVLGYPWTSEYFSDELNPRNIEPTITRGIVTNVNPGGNNKYFQIDASVEGGNSGGPGLNSKGEVIGIATLGFDNTGGIYNYLIRINDIKAEIQESISPSQGVIDEYWIKGLENYWDGNYKKARKSFDNVLSTFPDHPYVKNVIKNINSEGGVEEFPSTNTSFLYALVIVLIIVIIFLGNRLIGKKKKKKRKKK